ncbi:MAG TPA: CorA family divalent cation transporter [Frankiaceae bacterium]|nr:CorA family divalent cation transporter [Frankiaceae bacterium]
MLDEVTAARSIAASARDERAQVAKTWRGATTLLDAFGLPTLSRENAVVMQEALAREGVRTDPLLTEVERKTKVRLLLPGDDPRAPQDLVADGRLTATLWRRDRAPQSIPIAEAASRPPGSLLWLDIDPSAEVPAAFDVLHLLLPELERQALEDLLQVDDLPGASSYGPVHKLSTVAIEAVEPEDDRRNDDGSKAGALSFLVVEILAGPNWLLTCWHEPRKLPAGALPEDRLEVKGPALREIEQCWRERGDDSLPKLVLLLCREIARSYPTARRTLYSWLEQWELEFHRVQDPVEQATLRDLRVLISEMHRRLHALEETRFTGDENNWLAGESTKGQRQELQGWLDRGTRGLTNLAGTLRTATELQTSAGIRRHLELAQEQAGKTDRLQDQVGLVTSVLLVPTFIAGLFGANTTVPGQGHWSGFVLMVALMVLGSGSTYVLFRRIRSGQPPAAE